MNLNRLHALVFCMFCVKCFMMLQSRQLSPEKKNELVSRVNGFPFVDQGFIAITISNLPSCHCSQSNGIADGDTKVGAERERREAQRNNESESSWFISISFANWLQFGFNLRSECVSVRVFVFLCRMSTPSNCSQISHSLSHHEIHCDDFNLMRFAFGAAYKLKQNVNDICHAKKLYAQLACADRHSRSY